MWFHCISFQWSLSSSKAVFILYPIFLIPATSRDRGISRRLSPACSWSQRKLSEAVTDCCAYVWLFHHLTGWNMNLAAPSRAWGLFSLFPRHHVPHSAAGFSLSPAVSAGSSCWQVAHLTSGTLLLPLTRYMPVSTSCFNSLVVGYLYVKPVPLTAATFLPTFSVLATQRNMIRCHAIQVIRRPSADGEEPEDVDLSPILWLMGSDISGRLIHLAKPESFLLQNGSDRM